MRGRRWWAIWLVGLLALAGCQRTATGGVATTAGQSFALTYVAIGASDAFGVGTDFPAEQSWPSVLATDLSPATHLINLGIPQATTAEALTAEVPIAADARPAIITVWLGVNDIEQQVPLATFSANLTTLLSRLRAGTTARVYVGNLPDLTLLPFFQNQDQSALRAEIAAWNAAIAADVAATGTQLVDIFTNFASVANHPEYLSGDGLHPSALGARELAVVFAAAIGNG